MIGTTEALAIFTCFEAYAIWPSPSSQLHFLVPYPMRPESAGAMMWWLMLPRAFFLSFSFFAQCHLLLLLKREPTLEGLIDSRQTAPQE